MQGAGLCYGCPRHGPDGTSVEGALGVEAYEQRYPDLARRAADAGLELRFADLPLTRLHFITGGDGPPLVMVPATYSAISDYIGLVRFMAQRFHIYFFELPGHGLSAPFAEPFSSDLVARTVGDLLDSEGHARASIMGFSFGGILALASLELLRDRIDSAILLSPCATHRAMKYDRWRIAVLRNVVRALRPPHAQRLFVSALRHRVTAAAFGWFVKTIGRMEGVNNLVR
ncbi:MAG: alpha/beta fold hydrolase, partial [Actinobacteria bacterium]